MFLRGTFLYNLKNGIWQRIHKVDIVVYANPTSRFKNYMLSDSLLLQRGAQCGYPLSLFPFDSALEPLAIAIRNKGDRKGTRLGR